jgi:Cu(I)/Ag(I) efflux system protein CusF
MNRYSTIFSAAILMAGAFNAPAVFAQDHSQHMASAASKAGSMSSGEIVKVDKAAGKLTIKHGPLSNLNMPGMTMGFKVNNAAMLDQVKAGDKVSFVAEKVNGTLTVTTLEAAK